MTRLEHSSLSIAKKFYDEGKFASLDRMIRWYAKINDLTYGQASARINKYIKGDGS